MGDRTPDLLGAPLVFWSERMWSTGEGNGKPLQYSDLENPMNSMKRQKDRILKEELVNTLYATSDQWINNSRKNEGMEPKQKQYPAVDVTNLDSILKSRDIPLPTKVHLVKAMVFPVVRYGCESWIVKKAECRRIDAFEL